jgi:hypothetical protein
LENPSMPIQAEENHPVAAPVVAPAVTVGTVQWPEAAV